MNDNMYAMEDVNLNEWRPIKFYFTEKGKHDWALVRFKEKASAFAGIPHVCEWRTSGKFGAGWYLQDWENDKTMFEYLNNSCIAIAFFEWPECPTYEWPECLYYIDEEIKKYEKHIDFD